MRKERGKGEAVTPERAKKNGNKNVPQNRAGFQDSEDGRIKPQGQREKD